MSKQKPKFVNSRLLKIVLALAVILTVLWGGSLLIPRQSASVFVVTTPIESGTKSVTGTLKKDSPVGATGSYFIEMSDGKLVALDSQDIDSLVGLQVTAEGYLDIANNGNYFMLVKSITLAE